jgi:hypothetical protein
MVLVTTMSWRSSSSGGSSNVGVSDSPAVCSVAKMSLTE